MTSKYLLTETHYVYGHAGSLYDVKYLDGNIFIIKYKRTDRGCWFNSGSVRKVLDIFTWENFNECFNIYGTALAEMLYKSYNKTQDLQRILLSKNLLVDNS